MGAENKEIIELLRIRRRNLEEGLRGSIFDEPPPLVAGELEKRRRREITHSINEGYKLTAKTLESQWQNIKGH